jgi:hypothetical protein
MTIKARLARLARLTRLENRKEPWPFFSRDSRKDPFAVSS